MIEIYSNSSVLCSLSGDKHKQEFGCVETALQVSTVMCNLGQRCLSVSVFHMTYNSKTGVYLDGEVLYFYEPKCFSTFFIE